MTFLNHGAPNQVLSLQNAHVFKDYGSSPSQKSFGGSGVKTYFSGGGSEK